MNPDLLRLKLAILVSLSLAACFGWFVAQRVYYYYRTRPLDAVETVKIKIFPEWTLGLVSIFLLWFGLAGLSVVGGLNGFSTLSVPKVLCELEVAAAGAQGFTLLAFDRIDAEAPDAARRRGVMVSAGEGFEVEVQRVGFGSLLALFGQQDMVRVVGVRPLGGSAARRARPSAQSGSENGLEVTLSGEVSGGALLWPFMPVVETVVLTGKDLAQGEVMAVRIGADGIVTLEKQK